ncbi:MAG: hypothetical protein FJY88_05225 [Candidatus Eisenbacteria bacterium]|nr:hypothetical protein [Candidatus Eisenbacteria bacterium]
MVLARRFWWVAVVGIPFGLGVLGLAGVSVAAPQELIADGDFSACATSKVLRQDNKGPDWCETRKDGKEGRKLLMLSKKDVAGNATPKAMLKAHPDLNTYLSQRFAAPQKDDFSIQYDICVREILPDDNRSAFCMVGKDSDKKAGPNSTGGERFVFLGFENAPEKGKINLFARQGKTPWEQKTIVAKGLDLNKWYTIELAIYPSAAAYEVSVKGITQPVELDAFSPSGKAPKRLTHISFASWNDGAGTFYIDNVIARAL